MLDLLRRTGGLPASCGLRTGVTPQQRVHSWRGALGLDSTDTAHIAEALAAAEAASTAATATVASTSTSAASSTQAPPTAATASSASDTVDLATDVQQILAKRGLNAWLNLALQWCDSQGFESIAEVCEAEEEVTMVAALDIKPGKAKLLIQDLRRTSGMGTAHLQAEQPSASSTCLPRSKLCSHMVSPLQPAPSPTSAFASPNPPVLATARSGKNSLELAPRPPLTALPSQPSARLTQLPDHLYRSGREAAEAGLLPAPPFPITTRSNEAGATDNEQTPAADNSVRSASSGPKPMSTPFKATRGLTTPAVDGRPSGASSRRASIAAGVPSRELCTPLPRLGGAPQPSSAPTATGSAWASEEGGPSSPESVASEPPASTVRPRVGVVSRLPLVRRSGPSSRSFSPKSPLACSFSAGSAIDSPSRPAEPTHAACEAEPRDRPCDGDDVDWETGTPPQASTPNASSGIAQSLPRSSHQPAIELAAFPPAVTSTRSRAVRAGDGLCSLASNVEVPQPAATTFALTEALGVAGEPVMPVRAIHRLAGADGGRLHSAVGYAEAILGADGVVRYELTLIREHQRWGLLKRYRDWRALRAQLEQSFPEVRRVAERFPPRRFHVFALCAAAPGGRHDPQLLNERAHLLAEWLDEVLRMLPPSVDDKFFEFQAAQAHE
eukprot:scaffold16716_cov134-Isochrysis_galbana.AAC.11